MSKKLFLEAVNLGAACLSPGDTSRHLITMLANRIEPLREEFPHLIGLILPKPEYRYGKAIVTVDGFWLAKFCTSLYDGLYMLELEAEEYIPPPPPPKPKMLGRSTLLSWIHPETSIVKTVLGNVIAREVTTDDDYNDVIHVTVEVPLESYDEVYFD